MSLTVAIQMDPIESIDINGDSTFVLALEAQARGYKLYHYGPQDLSFLDGEVIATARPLEVRREHGNHYTLGDAERINLADTDVVLMRQDPPFDMSYITATHLLERVHPKTLVVNDPVSVRNAPEKIFVTHFDGVLPPTLISSNLEEMKAFREEHKDIIIKPLYGNGGAGVFHLKPGDENLTVIHELFNEFYREPMIIQKYLPEVRNGDKRIILVDGKPVGAINRVPQEGESRSNMHVGGQALKTELTPREQEICDIIGPSLKEQGLIFVGIDVIGDYMTEINVTSPTGIQEINRYDGVKLEAEIWDCIEAKL
ncbi:glutathione synthase [Sneathiella sp. P13V-1]|uniref:glutathione synthase n=1 Tax=Sneathiella sp. P13V-1 TaxID=2697366 RepID=UPI00187B86D8|nr:glutathione synthase [Sneathiella sp. P13V-1]MBE7635786.1 glutathione synthase [Sneathiella sp. P13V-1]